MNRLIALTLRLYPARVRERYGDELTEMLTDSPRPVRDLVNVIGCALIDRMHAMTTVVAGNPRRAAGRLVLVLAVAPVLINAGRLATAGLLSTLYSTRHMSLYARTPVMLLATILLTAAAATAGRVLARSGTRPSGAGFAAANCALVLGYELGWPLSGVGSSYTWYPLVMVATWAAGVWALARWARFLAKAGRPRLAALIAIVGGLVLIDTVFAGCLIAQNLGWPTFRSFYGFAPLWYPTLLGEGGWVFDSGDGRFGLGGIDLGAAPVATGLWSTLGPAMGILPLILTICTAYVLSQAPARSSNRTLAELEAPAV